MERGKFIVFEGVGGSGKTTQIGLAGDFLRKSGFDVLTTREPGGIESAEKIRKLIFSLRDKKLIGPEGQMVLFFAARFLWVNDVVRPALNQGKIVLTDRCHTSTAAYQGFAEGGNLSQIEEISKVVMGDTLPDAVVLLDISSDVAQERRMLDKGGDPFDKEGKGYLERLVLGYRRMASESWGNLRWYKVDGEGTIEEVSQSVAEVLREILEIK
jgi:dTMP kinase